MLEECSRMVIMTLRLLTRRRNTYNWIVQRAFTIKNVHESYFTLKQRLFAHTAFPLTLFCLLAAYSNMLHPLFNALDSIERFIRSNLNHFTKTTIIYLFFFLHQEHWKFISCFASSNCKFIWSLFVPCDEGCTHVLHDTFYRF